MFTLVKIIGVALAFAVIVLYNRKLVKFVAKSGTGVENLIGRTLGRQLKRLDDYLERQTTLANNNVYGKISSYYNYILVNLELKKDRITVPTFIVFICILTTGLTIGVLVFTANILLSLASFFLFFYLITVTFNFLALLRYEKREGMIMDVEDLLSMGIGRGVKNAITVYTPSIHPLIRPYFEDFLDDINHHGKTFNASMDTLNHNLGDGFSHFSRLAKQYEAKAEKGSENMFSPIIETNQRKRDVRQRVNKRFSELKTNFMLAAACVFGFVFFLVYTDERGRELILHNTWGNISLLTDVMLIAFVQGVITTLKAKFLQ